VVVAKAYADWVTRSPELRGASQFINDPPALYAAGIEPVYVPTRLPHSSTPDSQRTLRVKNSVDVKMTADCIECAHSHPNINTYVLVSGDSDFIHVINALRSMGKRAVIIGVSWSTSRRLADQVDGLILYDTDVDPETPPEPAPPPPTATGRPSSRGSTANRQQLSDVIRVIEDIVRTERQAGRTPLLTSLKQRLMRRMPGFDEKKLGFSGFKKLMLRACEDGNIKLATVGLVDWVIMADEIIPQESSGETAGVVEGTAVEIAVSEEEVKATETTQAVPELVLAAVTSNGDEPGAELPAARVIRAAPRVNLELALTESLAKLKLPEGPDDGLNGRRVTDLIVMADTLEHRDGVDQVAFNLLVSEVCQALSQGLEAQNEEITPRWGQAFSRNYVTRMVRGLKEGDIFRQEWRTVLDQESGKKRRRSTFNLNQEHDLVRAVLASQYQAAEDPPEVELLPVAVTPAAQPYWAAEPQPVEAANSSPQAAAPAADEVETLNLADLDIDPSLLKDPSLENPPGSNEPGSPIGRFMRFLSRP